MRLPVRGWRYGGSVILDKSVRGLSACESSRHLTARRGVDSSLVQIAPQVYRSMCHSSQTIQMREVWNRTRGRGLSQFETISVADGEFTPL